LDALFSECANAADPRKAAERLEGELANKEGSVAQGFRRSLQVDTGSLAWHILTSLPRKEALPREYVHPDALPTLLPHAEPDDYNRALEFLATVGCVSFEPSEEAANDVVRLDPVVEKVI
jgi:hypothetical protein